MSELNKYAVAIHILQQARDLLSEPKRWTKDVFARDEEGGAVDYLDDNAVCWCLQGAIMRYSNTSNQLDINARRLIEARIEHITGVYDIANFNDAGHVTHFEILNAVDTALSDLRVCHSQLSDNA